MRFTNLIGRLVAMGAVLVAIVAVVIVVFAGGGGYKVNALFQNASQIVKGDLVQVSGQPIGKVQGIKLTDDGQADIELKIDKDYKPLREGTRLIVRAVSLSGVANRYVDVQLGPAAGRPIPNGGTIPAHYTTTAVDLDQLFNIFNPRTRQALQGVIKGFATLYAGRGRQANPGFMYLNPSLAATSRLFAELNRDPVELQRLITKSAGLFGDLAQRRDQISSLVSNLARTTGAIGAQHDALASAVHQLPEFMRRANTTFVNLRATLDDLKPLVDDSKPVAKKLRPFLRQLRPFAEQGRPTIRDLSALVGRAGKGNDLVELTKSNIPLRNASVSPVQANGKEREGAFPATARALGTAAPELAFARPYAPDLTGWFDDFSHTGYYDALGGTSRVSLLVNLFTIVDGLPTNTIIPPDQRAAVFNAAAKIHQNNRCPGSLERDPGDGSGIPYHPDGFDCDPTQVPPGQ